MTDIFLRRALPVAGALALSAALLPGCTSAPAAQPTPAPTAKPTATAVPTPTPVPTIKPHATGIALYGIKTPRKVFALTFDDGPDPSYTPKILAILKAKKAPATFFMVGEMVNAHAATAKLVKAAGFPIGNHSYRHPSRPRDPVGEVDRTDKALMRVLNLKPTLFRPPYGIINNGMAKEASRRGQDVILWTTSGNDWNKHNSANQIKINVLTGLKPGGIGLMHDGGGNRSKTVAMLPSIIDTLRARGYTLVTVPQLLAMGVPEQAPIGGSHVKHLKTKARLKKTLAKKVTAKTAASLPGEAAPVAAKKP